jgi:hypothetical protein
VTSPIDGTKRATGLPRDLWDLLAVDELVQRGRHSHREGQVHGIKEKDPPSLYSSRGSQPPCCCRSGSATGQSGCMVNHSFSRSSMGLCELGRIGKLAKLESAARDDKSA